MQDIWVHLCIRKVILLSTCNIVFHIALELAREVEFFFSVCQSFPWWLKCCVVGSSVHGIEGLSLEGFSLRYSSLKIYIVKSRLNMCDIEKGKKTF